MNRARRRPLDDREVLELLRDEPELLAVADAVSATRRRRANPAVLGVLVVAFVAVVAVVRPWSAGSRGIVEAAHAALGSDPVVHSVVTTKSAVDTRIDLATGRRRPVEITVETWSDPSRGRVRSVIHHDRLIVADITGPAVSRAVPGLIDQGERLFSTGYREALAAKRAHVLRRGRFAGHDAVWLDVGFRGRHEDVIVDADSSLPLAFEEASASKSPAVWFVKRIESVPRRAADFRARQQFAAGSGRVVGATSISAEEAEAAIGFRPTWAGQKLRGYRLDSLTLQRLTQTVGSRRTTSNGLLIIYRDRRGRALTISQALSPQVAYGYMRGRLSFNLNEVTPSVLDLARVGQAWIGQRRFRRLYVTIQAGDLACVIAFARSLRPFRPLS
jgi:hypothetical protein